MDLEKETQLKRFKIIEPFLRKEKKLKEIEKETDISYATLKRWIKAYKEKGILGLDKKERQDKNSFRAIDNEGIDIIKKVYKTAERTVLQDCMTSAEIISKRKNTISAIRHFTEL